MPDILILAALREETAAMRRMDGAAVVITGDGAARAASGAAQAIDRVRPRVIIGIGIAGAISPDLDRGDLVAGRVIVDEDGQALECDRALVATATALGAKSATLVSSRTVVSSAEKQQLAHSIDSTAAVDLESAAWHRAASERGLPFISIRCILDPASDDLPEIVARSVRADGSVSRLQVVARALIQPSEIAALLHLRRSTAESAATLARFLVAFVEKVRER